MKKVGKGKLTKSMEILCRHACAMVMIFYVCTDSPVVAQEINARVSVVYAQVATTVDRKVFQTLQNSLVNFINKRKWTSDAFDPKERIDCNFLLQLQSVQDQNIYQASLTVQAARPVYNTTYLSPLINYQDNDVTFRYVEFQPLEFNENRIAGVEPLAANLTAILAYYIHIILGLDYDSFSPRGGDPYFQKALNIVNSAPDGRGISGWRPFDGQRNRYWLAENLMNSRYSMIHDAYYTYYRSGMDRMYEDEKATREQMLNSLNMLNTLRESTPN
ncbi:MAG: DUF4835 family protein, partial [Acidobacteria bacterium]|nr:DUF4835 family protein [Acidobacteriota bacterium]